MRGSSVKDNWNICGDLQDVILQPLLDSLIFVNVDLFLSEMLIFLVM